MSRTLVTHYTVSTDKYVACYMAGFFHVQGHLYPCNKLETPAAFEIDADEVWHPRNHYRNMALKFVKRAIARTMEVSKTLSDSRFADCQRRGHCWTSGRS